MFWWQPVSAGILSNYGKILLWESHCGSIGAQRSLLPPCEAKEPCRTLDCALPRCNAPCWELSTTWPPRSGKRRRKQGRVIKQKATAPERGGAKRHRFWWQLWHELSLWLGSDALSLWIFISPSGQWSGSGPWRSLLVLKPHIEYISRLSLHVSCVPELVSPPVTLSSLTCTEFCSP